MAEPAPSAQPVIARAIAEFGFSKTSLPATLDVT
jgi:hypothetical protein